MPVEVNVRQLEKQDLDLKGEIPAEELEFSGLDECIESPEPLHYEVHAELMERSVLVQGRLTLDLRCACVRCLKVFTHRLDLRDWAAHLALEGEEAVAVLNDVIDLAPPMREDVLLEFPQHPLCEPGCQGLSAGNGSGNRSAEDDLRESRDSSPWAELDKLKL